MRLLLPASILLLSSAAPLLAQKSEIEVRADIAFAKGLANSWGFVDLSEEVIRNLEAGALPGKLADEVGLLKCEVYFAAAKTDATRREALLKKSIDAYRDFIDKHGFSELKDVAEAGLVEVSAYYAKALASRLEDAVGEEAVTLKAELQTVLTNSVSKTSELIDALSSIKRDERSEADTRRLYELLLSKGDMLLELAKAQDDGTFSYEQSRKAYEKLSDEAVEGSPWSLRAYIGIADNLTARGEYAEAAGFYEFAVDFSITRDLGAWQAAVKEQGITQEEKQARFLFVQMGTIGLVRALLQSGETSDAIAWGLHCHNTWKREGLDLLQPIGYLALLEVARAMIDAGGYIGGNVSAGEATWYATQEEITAAGVPKNKQKTALDFALSLAQQVNEANKGNNLQLRAQKVIAEIISRPGVVVDPNMLFDAAQGSFNEQDWGEAIEAMKRVVIALHGQDPATRQELMPKVMWHIGRSYQKLDRNLEAAAVYEAALEQWRGDPQFDELSAKGFVDTANALKRAAKGDPLMDQLVQRAEKLITEVSSGGAVPENIKFRNAEKAYDAKDFEKAKSLYASVGAAGDDYEKAIVSVGVCDYKLGRFEQAIRSFDDYLNKFIEDPKNQTIDSRRLATRKSAKANATFYWGLSLFELASAKKGEWKKVVDMLDGFHLTFPEQTQLAPAALYRVVYARAQQGQNAEVKALLAEMIKVFPESQWTGRAAKESYDILKAAYEAESDPARKQKLLREMAENLQTLNRTSANPAFNNMKTEANHWKALGEWATTEELLKRILAQFGSDPANQEDITRYVLPDLGEALLRQHKVVDATATLLPLMDAEAKIRASRSTALYYSMSVSGWIEFSPSPDGKTGKVQEIAGSGTRSEDFEPAAKALNDLAGTTEKWTKDWYAYKAQQIYLFMRWTQFDGKKIDVAKEQMSFLATQLGASQFKTDDMPEETRQLYLWLQAKLK